MHCLVPAPLLFCCADLLPLECLCIVLRFAPQCRGTLDQIPNLGSWKCMWEAHPQFLCRHSLTEQKERVEGCLCRTLSALARLDIREPCPSNEGCGRRYGAVQHFSWRDGLSLLVSRFSSRIPISSSHTHGRFPPHSPANPLTAEYKTRLGG
jgi:hypothetical protein